MTKTMRFLFTLAAVALLAGTGCTSKAKKAYHQSRANHYYEANQLGQAEIEYMNVLRYDPANSLALGRLGLIYYDQGRLQRALYFLGKGSAAAPDNLELRLKLGFLYSSVGQYTQAVEQANFVLDKNPKDQEAPILLMEGSILPKNVETARKRLQALAQSGDTAGIEVALGSIALRDRDVATASVAYKKAQALDPKSPAVNASLAALAWAQEDLKQAGEFFKAASDASPPRSPRRMQYIRFKIDTGDLAGARAALAEIQKAVPDYLPANMVLAQVAAVEKKYDECDDALRKVLELDPDNFDALFFQGQIDLARGAPDKAVADMERMARIYAQVPQVHNQLGMAYLAADDLPKAADSFRRVLEINPNYLEAVMSLAQIQIRNNNPGPALIALEKVRQKQPRLVSAQLLLADAYRMQNRVGDAMGIYAGLEAIYPTNVQVILLHGAALKQVEDNAGARKSFERVLELSPGHIPAIEQLVDLDITETNYDAATQLVTRELQRNPKQVAMRMLGAKIFIAQGKRDKAEAALLDVLHSDPSSQGANLLLAQIYSDTGQLDKALARVNAAMALDPKNTSALMLAGQLYDANKDYKGAADAYEKLLKVDGKWGPALNNLAYIYSERLNNLDRAYELASRAHDLMPYEPSTADTLGWVNFKKGAYLAALTLLTDSAAKMGALPEVQYHLGMASYMNADEAGARAALQRAWRPGTEFPGRDECGRSLSILDINPATADDTARATLEKRVAEKSDDPVALVRLARIYQRDGNTNKAVAAYESILQALPKNLDAMVNLTRLYANDPKKAYEMAKSANKLAPYDEDVAHTLGRLAFQAGDFRLATSVLQQTAQNRPNDAALLYDYAQAAYSIGKVAVAQTALQNAAPNLTGAPAGLARRNLDMIALAGAPDQAAAAGARIDDVLKSEPNDAPALMARAAASEFNSDIGTAEKACEKVLDRFPDFAPAQKQLARLYFSEPAKLDRALAQADKAHEALPDDPETTKILGSILVQKGDYSHAVNLLKQSAAKLPADASVFYYLGSAQFQLKNHVESKASLQQALNLKLSGPQAESARKMLNELK